MKTYNYRIHFSKYSPGSLRWLDLTRNSRNTQLSVSCASEPSSQQGNSAHHFVADLTEDDGDAKREKMCRRFLGRSLGGATGVYNKSLSWSCSFTIYTCITKLFPHCWRRYGQISFDNIDLSFRNSIFFGNGWYNSPKDIREMKHIDLESLLSSRKSVICKNNRIDNNWNHLLNYG